MSYAPPPPRPGCFDENVALDYATGALDAASSDEIVGHAEACATCRRVLSELGRALGAPGPADAPAAVPAPPPPGTRVGRYQVLRPLGAGAMGVVYLAYDPELDRRVALKLLAQPAGGSDADATSGRAASLRAEAQAMAKASHPNLVAVYDVGEWGGRVYLTMELVEGASLRAWLHDHERSWREVVLAFVAAGEGLEAAHRAGVVHGDFKPDNVLLDGDGRAKVGDFGLAVMSARRAGAQGGEGGGGRAEGGDAGGSGRAEGGDAGDSGRPAALQGTPAYMAPELWRGERADAKSDQFAFCVALSEALFGGRPRPGGEPDGAAAGGRRAARGRVPGRVRAALRRGLSVRPLDRHASMGALVRALRPRRPGALALAAPTAAATAAVVAAAMAWRSGGEGPCAHAERRLAGAWDETRRVAVREAMLGSGAPFAADVWRSVERRLDRYAVEWADARTRACLAERSEASSDAPVGATPPAGRAGARAACLDDKLLELGALTRELVTSDPKRLSFATAAVEGLPGPPECERGEWPARSERASAEPGRQERAAEVRRQLAEARATWSLGRYVEAHQQAQGALGAARALGSPELEATALALVSTQNVLLEAAPDVAGLLNEAYLAAEAARLDDAKMSVTVGFSWHAGCRALDAGTALHWAQLGFATHRRVGGSELQEANLQRSMANALLCADRYAEAARHYERAAEIQERLQPSSLALGTSLTNLAAARVGEGRADLAAPLYDRAQAVLERAVGAAHPAVGAVHSERGFWLLNRGEWEPAREQLERALALYRSVYEPSHFSVVAAQNRLTFALVRLGRGAEAAARQATLLEAFRAELERPGPVAASVMAVAGWSLTETGRGEEGLDLLRRATRALGAAPTSVYSTYLAPAEAWKGGAELRAGRRAEAIASFERALTLFETQHETSPSLPELQFALARALGRTPRALALAEQARARFGALPSEYGRRRAGDIEAWLAAPRAAAPPPRPVAPRRPRAP